MAAGAAVGGRGVKRELEDTEMGGMEPRGAGGGMFSMGEAGDSGGKSAVERQKLERRVIHRMIG